MRVVGFFAPFWGHGVVLALFCSGYEFLKIKNALLLNLANFDTIRYGCYTGGSLLNGQHVCLLPLLIRVQAEFVCGCVRIFHPTAPGSNPKPPTMLLGI